jgi:hypothetical protein
VTGTQQVVLFVWLASAAGGALIASSKGRSGMAWGVLGFLFGLFALLVVALLPAKKTAW